MNTSSTRLRLGAALAVTTLGLFSLGGSAFAGEGNGQGGERRNDRAGASSTERGNQGADRPAVEGPDDDDSQPDIVSDDSDNMHPSGQDRHEDKGAQGHSTSDPDSDDIGQDNDSDGPDNDGDDKPFLSADGTGGVDQQDQDGNNGCGNDDDFEDDNNGNCGGRRPTKATSPMTPPVVGGETTEKCPKAGEVASGQMPEGCDTDEEKECPEAGGTMAEGCEVEDGEVTGGDTVTGGTVAPGAVAGGTLAPGAVAGTQLQNIPAAEAVETRVLGVTIERGAVAGETAAATGGTGTSVLGASVTRGSVLARTGFGLTLAGLVGLALVLVGAGLQRAGRSEHGPLA